MTKSVECHVSPRCKGRPRCFDRDKALYSALGVFWRRGYEPASIAELCAAMGINAPSLYAAFGNKAELFLEAVRFYKALYWKVPSEKFMAEPDIHKGINDFFQEAVNILLSPDSPCGCLVALATINVSDDSEDVAEAVRKLRFATKNTFAARLQQAVDDGQLPPETDAASLSSAFSSMLEGLSLQARDGLPPEALKRVASYAVRLLPNGKSVL